MLTLAIIFIGLGWAIMMVQVLLNYSLDAKISDVIRVGCEDKWKVSDLLLDMEAQQEAQLAAKADAVD